MRSLGVVPGLLLVHAHPDDESITCGGVMALAAASGIPVTLVTCTLGERGEVIPPPLRHLSGDALGAHRAGELDAACAALGVTDHRLLGGRGRWHDSGMVETGDGIRAAAPETVEAGAFAAPEGFDAQVDELVEVLAEVRPDVVVSYDAFGGYGHPDHVRAHEITGAAVEAADPGASAISLYATAASADDVAAGLAALEARAWLAVAVPAVADLPVRDDAEITTRVALGTARARKLAALRAHATQVVVLDDDGEPPAFVLSNEIAQPVTGSECFVRLRGPHAGPDTLFPA